MTAEGNRRCRLTMAAAFSTWHCVSQCFVCVCLGIVSLTLIFTCISRSLYMQYSLSDSLSHPNNTLTHPHNTHPHKKTKTHARTHAHARAHTHTHKHTKSPTHPPTHPPTHWHLGVPVQVRQHCHMSSRQPLKASRMSSRMGSRSKVTKTRDIKIR